MNFARECPEANHPRVHVRQQAPAFGWVGDSVDHERIVVERARERFSRGGELRVSESDDFHTHPSIFAHQSRRVNPVTLDIAVRLEFPGATA